ncbi:MAG: AsmA family protein [Rickettsiales bacterium]|jgi:hypothetical protein|nr:AsmA family protein [Rickettsiales bacterium]
MKRKTRARIIWFSTLIIAAVGISILIFPAFMDFSYLKPGLAAAISEQSGRDAKIDGAVRITLLPRPILRAHLVSAGDIRAESVQFPIRITDFLNPANISVPGAVSVRGAIFGDFKNINGRLTLDGRRFTGSFVHNDRRFTADIKDGRAKIENSALSLETEFDYKFSGGKTTAAGHFRGSFPNLEEFLQGFGYSFGAAAARPLGIDANFVLSENSLKLTDMTLSSTDTIMKGNATFGKTSTLDLTMIEGDLGILESAPAAASVNISGEGKFKFGERTIRKFEIRANGDEIQKAEIQGEDFSLRARGKLKDGLPKDIEVSLYKKDGSDIIGIAEPVSIRCNSLSWKSADDWGCNGLSINTENLRISGSAGMGEGGLMVWLEKTEGQDTAAVIKKIKKEAAGDIHIILSDTIGFYKASRAGASHKYRNISGTLAEIPFKMSAIEKIPAALRAKFKGEITAETDGKDQTLFVKSENMGVALYESGGEIRFVLSGADLAETLQLMFPGFDTAFMKSGIGFDFSGEYRLGNFENLRLTTKGVFAQTIYGRGADTSFAFKTAELNIDTLLSNHWIMNYEQMQFLHQAPLMGLFKIAPDFSLVADKVVIFDGQEYKNLVFSKAGNVQKISVESTGGGTGFAEITRRGGSEFEISAKASGFAVPGALIGRLGLDIMDASITGEALLTTFGLVANDISENMEGSADISITGGKIVGIDTRQIFGKGLTRANIGEFLERAFSPKASMEIKTLSIPVRISGSEIISSAPFVLKTDSATISGDAAVMAEGTGASMQILFRNSSSESRPLSVIATPKGAKFDEAEALRAIDPDYIRAK